MRKALATAIRGRSDDLSYSQRIEVRGDKTSSLTTVSKDNMILSILEKL